MHNKRNRRLFGGLWSWFVGEVYPYGYKIWRVAWCLAFRVSCYISEKATAVDDSLMQNVDEDPKSHERERGTCITLARCSKPGEEAISVHRKRGRWSRGWGEVLLTCRLAALVMRHGLLIYWRTKSEERAKRERLAWLCSKGWPLDRKQRGGKRGHEWWGWWKNNPGPPRHLLSMLSCGWHWDCWWRSSIWQ